MRRGEICGLMWEDIDLGKQIIHVRHNAVFTSSQTVVSEALKTSAAVRDIVAAEMILEHNIICGDSLEIMKKMED